MDPGGRRGRQFAAARNQHSLSPPGTGDPRPGKEEAPILEVEPDFEIRFRYEDGPRDCEAVAVDATESAIYLLSKELVTCRMCSCRIPAAGSAGPHVARYVAEVRLPFPTAMDISPDGRRAVVLTYGDACLFSRAEGNRGQAFSAHPAPSERRLAPGAICYRTGRLDLYLTSENAPAPVEIPVVK